MWETYPDESVELWIKRRNDHSPPNYSARLEYANRNYWGTGNTPMEAVRELIDTAKGKLDRIRKVVEYQRKIIAEAEAEIAKYEPMVVEMATAKPAGDDAGNNQGTP